MRFDSNELFNEELYPEMTKGDAERISNLNSKNYYGINYNTLRRLIKQHRKARLENDKRTMSKVEYRLTDVNFHTECGLLKSGKYDEALALKW